MISFQHGVWTCFFYNEYKILFFKVQFIIKRKSYYPHIFGVRKGTSKKINKSLSRCLINEEINRIGD